MFTVGARRMCAPLLCTSSASALPTSRTRLGFQVAPKATPAGEQAEVGTRRAAALRARSVRPEP